MTSPKELKSTISSGLLSFPLTDFDGQLAFAPKPYIERLEWLMPYGATAPFAAGGTGEIFSLEPNEFSEVVRTTVETCKGRMPIIASDGGGTTLAIRYATGSRARRRSGHLAAAPLPDRGDAGGADRPHHGGLQERQVRRDRLQPRRVPFDPGVANGARGYLPEPDRLQGRHR